MNQPWRARVPPLSPPRSEVEREANRLEALKKTPPGDVWVFAYGSLMWNPGFEPVETCPATLTGYRRRFAFWTMISRGTPEHPGLGLGLDPEPAAACTGLAYRLREDHEGFTADTRALWAREMHGSIYLPTWVTVSLPDGAAAALTFVLDRDHPQYAPDLTQAERAEIIAGAAGKFGTCRDYLASTVAHLAELGIREPDLDDLLARVDAIRAQRGDGV